MAFQWLRDGIPQKQDPAKIQRLALKDFARKIETVSDAEIVLNELVRSGLIKSYVLADTQAAKDFNEFLMWKRKSMFSIAGGIFTHRI